LIYFGSSFCFFAAVFIVFCEIAYCLIGSAHLAMLYQLVVLSKKPLTDDKFGKLFSNFLPIRGMLFVISVAIIIRFSMAYG
jgi:hypothetical protein